jgi:2-polyprenyl-3-methyl-5-hydroxy-6-metoxy-1,4-benzoquinol methylase
MNELPKAQVKWDKRYQDKADTPKSPSAPQYLQRNWNSLRPGRVLDLAAGDGAVSLYLADKGFDVSAVDISSVGLSLLNKNMKGQGYEVSTSAMDLESDETDLSSLGLFDSIVISRYKPIDLLWPKLIDLLKPEGTLLITTFNLMHHQRTGFSQRFCLQPSQYVDRFNDLALLSYEADIDLSGEDGYLFVKKSAQ